MTEIAIRESTSPALADKIEYARFLAKSGLLPHAYRDEPANIMYAIEYGAMLGLPPIAAIIGIHVIDGKPTMSAGLMAAKVREAGHRIRVETTGEGDNARARCTIVRADDPGFTYSAVWDMERARTAGLLGKTNWRHHPVQMLKNRATSECCRDACQEVLLGIHYTPDELGGDDDGGEIIHDGWPTDKNGIVDGSKMTEEEKDAAGMMTRAQRVEHDALRRMGEPPAGAVQILSEPDPDDPWAAEPPPEPAPRPARTGDGKPASPAALAKLEGLLGLLQLGPEEDVTALIHRLTSPAYSATAAEVRNVTTYLESHLEQCGGDVDKAGAAIWADHNRAKEAGRA